MTVRTALVTGAGAGLGRAIARRLGKGQFRVICADIDGGAARATAEAIEGDGGRAIHRAIDVSREDEVAAAHEELNMCGWLPYVVGNVAGILDRSQLQSLTAADFQHIYDVNVVGAAMTAKYFGPAMVARKWGRIINIASIAGTQGYPFPAYGASKAALINLTQSMLIDFWGTGVTVNAISPGAMDTPMLDRRQYDSFRSATPSGDLVAPDEVASVFMFLASDGARALNGQNIVVDGGATAVFRWPHTA